MITECKGNIVCDWLDSKVLKGNPAGLAPRRPISIYLPPEVEMKPSRKFPLLICLAPWMNAGRNLLGWQPFKEPLPIRFERLRQKYNLPPAIICAPDLFTHFGGSQFVDSEFFGPHGQFLVKEFIPFMEERYPVHPSSKMKAVFGRSSGGFGALRLALDYPGVVGAIACHSGDMGFDMLFGNGLLAIPNRLRKFSHSVQEFLDFCQSAKKLSSVDINVLMLLGCAGFYSPDLNSADGFLLPLDLYSGKLIDEVWVKWLSHDPVYIVKKKIDALKQLDMLYFDCGLRDQYHLLYGARQLHLALDEQKVCHHFFEFDDDHSGTDYRYDESLPLLLKAMSSD